jgi:hypothetical protein
MTTIPISSLSSSNLVPLDTAQECIRRYIDRIASKEVNPTYAFLIVHADIMQALGATEPLPGMDFGRFRVYFGLSSEELNFKMRLFLVPVDDSGHDILPVDGQGHMCVYDFNLPCPNTCDVDSPLYYGKLSYRA